MALKLNERYPGRFNNPSAGYPQGSFKNRTSPTAKDGSYLEKDWANDKEGFFQSLLSEAAVVPNGNADAVGSSQYYQAILEIIKARIKDSSPVIGSASNLKMTVNAASASASVTASEVIVGAALGGQTYRVAGFNKVINLANTGAGGMDTGTAPVNGWVALYAIYNPTSDVSALLAVNATAAVAPAVYGGANMPTGYVASALLTAVATNASSQFKPVTVIGRDVGVVGPAAFSTSTAVTNSNVSISASIPPNATKIWGQFTMSAAVTSSLGISITADSNQISSQNASFSFSGISTLITNFSNVLLSARQQVTVTTTVSTGTPSISFTISGYSI